MTIRFATISDEKQIFELFDECTNYLHSEGKPSKIGKGVFRKIIKQGEVKIFVAQDKGKLVGLATFYLIPNIRHGWNRGLIEDFFVTQSMRQHGVGTSIFKAIKKYCIKNNIKVVKLDSAVHLLAAHKFYEKHGGVIYGQTFRFVMF